MKQQERGVGLIFAEHTLPEQLHIDQGHHGAAPAHTDVPSEVRNGRTARRRFDEPGAGKPPTPRTRWRRRSHRHQRYAVTRQHLLAVRGRVVKADDGEARAPRGARPDDVDPFGGVRCGRGRAD